MRSRVGPRAQGSRPRVEGLGSGVQSLGSRVKGLGSRAYIWLLALDVAHRFPLKIIFPPASPPHLIAELPASGGAAVDFHDVACQVLIVRVLMLGVQGFGLRVGGLRQGGSTVSG